MGSLDKNPAIVSHLIRDAICWMIWSGILERVQRKPDLIAIIQMNKQTDQQEADEQKIVEISGLILVFSQRCRSCFRNFS